MKILNVMFTTRFGGLEQVFLDYNQLLQVKDHQVVAILHSQSPVAAKISSPFYKIANFSKYDPLTFLRLKKIVSDEKPNIVITHGNRAHYLVSKVAASVPVIGVSHNYSFDFIKYCDYVIAISHEMVRQLIAHGYPGSQIFYLPNQIEIPPDCQFQLPIFRTPPVIGVIARFEKLKGIEIFVQALHALRREKIAFTAKIAGNGPEYQPIQQLLSQLDLSADVELLGWVKNKPAFYQAIDILCVPSLSETFGLVILEGFLSSTPVIVSNLLGPMEIVADQLDALLFAAGDSEQLAKCLKRLLMDHQLAVNLARNGFEKVKNYDAKIFSKLAVAVITKCSNLAPS